jgi:large subunit ribosomal protein L20
MTRVKRSVHARKKRKKILKSTKGYRTLRSKIYTQARQAWLKAGVHSYRTRKLKKRDYKHLWLARISAALKLSGSGMTYSKFANAMLKKNVLLNRKVLADLALSHPEVFNKVVESVK